MSSTTTHHPAVYVNAAGKKTFVPLENNPQVFTDLVHRLGVSPKLGFYDVYSIDEPELLCHVPRPVHALIFIAPGNVYNTVRADEPGSKTLTYDRSGPDEPVIWIKQTIGHACGLMALIHSVGNGSAKNFIQGDSLLDRLLKEGLPLKPWPRAAVLYDSAELEQAHMSVAATGDSYVPSAEEPNSYHFISFVRADNGHLYEMDASWDGPIDRGLIGDDGDCLSEEALEMGIRRFVKKADGVLEFSVVALATRPDDEIVADGH